MGLTNSQYQAVMRSYEQKRLRSQDILSQRYREVYKKSPQFKALDESVSILSVQYGKRLLNGDEHAVASLKKELSILRKHKQELLDEAGFPPDYLEPVYECSICKDTGYIGSRKCRCFKKAVTALLYAQSNLKGVLEQQNFNMFRLDYYSDSYIDPKTGLSSCQIMKDALAVSKAFVKNFDTEHKNIFFYGNVGIGKTFLSNCIAQALMEAGYSVIYYSAPSFFSTLAESTFDKNDAAAKQMQEFIFQCDLLIIDDLGTELTNAFIASEFFTCVNERLLSRKSTVISTNLSLDSLASRYTERAFSRITSNYILLRLVGDDIRIKQKLFQTGRANNHAAQK